MTTRHSAITLAALSLLGSAAAVQAQTTSVQMYGVLDVAVRRSNHQGPRGADTLNSMLSGGVAPSRLGFNISEDLGDGLSAVANFEHRFQADTGVADAGPFWQQSWVGLQSKTLGRITVGRQYNVMFDAMALTYVPFKSAGPFLNSYKPEATVLLGARNDNQVKYQYVNGGLMVEAQVSAGEGIAFSTTQGKSIGGMARYASGAFAVGGGFLNRKDDAGREAKGYTFGGSYQAGPLYLNASVNKSEFSDGVNTALLLVGSGIDNAATGLTATQAANRLKQRSLVSAGGTYQLSTQLMLGAQYWHLTQSYYTTGADGKADCYAFLADYAFSKRTAVYTGLEFTKLGSLQLTNQMATPAAPNGQSNRTAVMVGLRHRF